MQKTSSTQWFTVSYNLQKKYHHRQKFLSTTHFLSDGLWLWGPLHKGKEEATQSEVWTARDVFGENILLCKSTPGGLNRYFTLLLMDTQSGIWNRHFQSPPRPQCASSLQGDLASVLHSITPASAWSPALPWEPLPGTTKLPQCRRRGCLRSWQRELGRTAAPKSLPLD